MVMFSTPNLDGTGVQVARCLRCITEDGRHFLGKPAASTQRRKAGRTCYENCKNCMPKAVLDACVGLKVQGPGARFLRLGFPARDSRLIKFITAPKQERTNTALVLLVMPLGRMVLLERMRGRGSMALESTGLHRSLHKEPFESSWSDTTHYLARRFRHLVSPKPDSGKNYLEALCSNLQRNFGDWPLGLTTLRFDDSSEISL